MSRGSLRRPASCPGKPGEKTGAVSAYAIEAGGKLRLINQLSSHGADPCHVSLTASGKHVLVDGSHTKSGEQSVVNAQDTAQVPLDGTHKKGLHGVLCPF